MKLKPFGSRLLILPQEKKNFITENKLEIVETGLSQGVVMEVSDDFSSLLKEGDIVVYSGEGKAQTYNGKQCLWIDARPVNQSGDVWFVIVDEEKIKE